MPEVIALPLENRIAQLFAYPISPAKQVVRARRLSKPERFIRRYGIGSIHLAYGTLDETRAWVRHLKGLALENAGVPILFGADAEQGLPHSFGFGTEFPWQMAIGATGDPTWAYKVGFALGGEARRAGIDMVYGPLAGADLVLHPGTLHTGSIGADRGLEGAGQG
jgi:beta-N-acetylhexosaminidase